MKKCSGLAVCIRALTHLKQLQMEMLHTIIMVVAVDPNRITTKGLTIPYT